MQITMEDLGFEGRVHMMRFLKFRHNEEIKEKRVSRFHPPSIHILQVTVQYKNKVAEVMNKGLSEEELGKELELLRVKSPSTIFFLPPD